MSGIKKHKRKTEQDPDNEVESGEHTYAVQSAPMQWRAHLCSGVWRAHLPGPKCNADFGASFRHLSDKTVAMKTPMSVSDTGQSLHWELGQFYMCPAKSA